MATQGPKDVNSTMATAGFTASAAMTDIGRSLGNESPEHAAQLGAKLTSGSGFQQIRKYHGLILASAIFFGGAIYGLSFLEGSSWGTVLGLIFMIVGSAAALGVAMALAIQFGPYSSLRMRCRFWPVEEPNVSAGASPTGVLLLDILLVTPFKLAAFLIIAPFLVLGMVWEIIRVFFLNLAGKKHVSYRGDEGKYYEKVRKEYAKHYHKAGVAAANEYLRMAYSGLLTPIGVMIPENEWNGGQHETWLAPMIERHGPVTKYCTGTPGSGSRNPGDTSDVISGMEINLGDGEGSDNRQYAQVPDKYSAI